MGRLITSRVVRVRLRLTRRCLRRVGLGRVLLLGGSMLVLVLVLVLLVIMVVVMVKVKVMVLVLVLQRRFRSRRVLWRLRSRLCRFRLRRIMGMKRRGFDELLCGYLISSLTFLCLLSFSKFLGGRVIHTCRMPV